MANTVTAITQPDNCIHPVENCILFELEGVGILSSLGIAAQACLTFNDTNFWAAGTYLFAGQTLDVGVGPGQVNLVAGTFQQRADAFEAWLRANSLFAFNSNIVNTSGVDLAIVCTFFNEPGPQENWTFTVPGFAVLNEFVGESAELANNFKFAYRLYEVDEFGDEKPICPLQCADPIFDEVGNPTPLPIDVQHDISPRLRTTWPTDLTEGVIKDTNITGLYFLRYGALVQAEGECSATLCNVQESTRFCVVNQALNLEFGDPKEQKLKYQIDDRNIAAFQVQFLTSAPNVRTVCLSDYDFLWINANWEKVTDTPVTRYFFLARFFDNAGGNVANVGELDLANNTDNVYRIPTGPANIANIANVAIPDLAGICYYEINVVAQIPSAPFILNFSEIVRYYIDHKCCCSHPIYFLDVLGGYTSMPFKCVESVDFTNEATEICLDTFCPDYTDELVSGRASLNSKGYATKTLELRRWPKTFENLAMFKAFKMAERKLEVFTDSDGMDRTRSVITVPGTTRIWQEQGVISMTIQVQDTQSYKTISQQ